MSQQFHCQDLTSDKILSWKGYLPEFWKFSGIPGEPPGIPGLRPGRKLRGL